MRTIRFAYWLFLTVLLGLLLTAGCTVKNKGTPHANQPPKVFFSAIPISGTIFTKPDQFFWFATDRDGYIIEFQYALQPDSIVRIAQSGAKADSAVRAFLAAHPVDTDTIWHWVVVDNLTRNGQTDTIALPTASKSPTDTLTRNSVVFVRARDDRQALSTDSIAKVTNFGVMDSLLNLNPNAIAYRLFGRKNRSPETYFQSISVCNKSSIASGLPTLYSRDADNYNDDPFMRVGHCGITARWTGDDSLDYPNQPQPPLVYFWELFGPFATQQASGPDTNRLWASTTYPIRYPGPPASRSARTFTSATSMTFFGLKGFDTLTNFRPGYYFFRVRSMDDAGVIDSVNAPLGKNPATFTFRVVHPRFDRKILLISKQPLDVSIFATGDASPPAGDSFKVQSQYLKLIRDAGYGGVIDSAQDSKFWQITASLPSGVAPNTVPESILARYQLVIFHKDYSFPSSQQPIFLTFLKAYMDAGGSVWGMGRDDLSDLIPIFNASQPEELPFNVFNPINGVGYFYFGAEKLMYSAHSLSVARDSFTREEFIGAEPLLTGFPALEEIGRAHV